MLARPPAKDEVAIAIQAERGVEVPFHARGLCELPPERAAEFEQDRGR